MLTNHLLPTSSMKPAHTLLYFILVHLLIVKLITSSPLTVSKCTNEQIELSCPRGSCSLDIASARFGFPEDDHCSYKETDCYTNASRVWQLCHEHSACSLHVWEERTSQLNCPVASAYLHISYTCKCSSCLDPGVPMYGDVTFSSPYLTHGVSVTYRCDGGYNLVGPAVRLCQHNGNWTGIQPACSIPPSLCPPAQGIMVSYGSVCFDFISSRVENFTTAQEECAIHNGSLVHVYVEQEFTFVQWQLSELKVNNRIWVDSMWPLQSDLDISQEECLELVPNTTDDKWNLHAAKCTYRNNFVCKYDVNATYLGYGEPTPRRDIGVGLGVGIGVAVVFIVVCLFFIICHKKKQDKHYANVDDSSVVKPNSDYKNQSNGVSQYDVEQVYYDDAISAGSTSVQGDITPPERQDEDCPNESNPDVYEGQADYDDVYIPDSNDGEQSMALDNQPNQYENVVVHNIVGSLKKKLKTWGNQEDSTETESDISSQMNDEDTVRRSKKPKPAPKPTLRDCKTQSLPSPTRRKAKDDKSSVNRDETFDNGEYLYSKPNKRNDVKSEIEIIENELYDDSHGKQPTTEL